MPIHGPGTPGGGANPSGAQAAATASLTGPLRVRQDARGALDLARHLRGAQPFLRQLQAAPGGVWNRLFIPYPCIAYPARDQVIPGTIGYLRHRYSIRDPIGSQAPPLESGRGEKCYLFTEGEWYIEATSLGTFTYSVVFEPVVDPAQLSFIQFARGGGEALVGSEVGFIGDTIMVSAQELIGATALELFPEGVIQFRWNEAVGASSDFFRLVADAPWVWENQLPIADLWAKSSTATARNLRYIIHYE